MSSELFTASANNCCMEHDYGDILYKELTDREDEGEGRPQRVCVPQRRCTPPGREGGNG